MLFNLGEAESSHLYDVLDSMATSGQLCTQLLLILGMSSTCLDGAYSVMIMKETAGSRQAVWDWSVPLGCALTGRLRNILH